MKLIEITGKIASKHLSVGDLVEFVNNQNHLFGFTSFPYSVGQQGRITHINKIDGTVSIVGGFCGVLAHRFKKIS